MTRVDKTRPPAAKAHATDHKTNFRLPEPPPFPRVARRDTKEGLPTVFSFASPRVAFTEFAPEAARQARPSLSRTSRVTIGMLAFSFLLSGSGFVSPSPVIRVNRLFLEAEVSCTVEGRVRLPREFNLLAALPGTRTTHQDQENLVKFAIQKSQHTALWVKRQDLVLIEGDVLSVTRDRNESRKNGTTPSHPEWTIGSVDWSKVHCPEPREDGKPQKFSVTLPVGIDPEFRINLERKLGFSCRRSWEKQQNLQSWLRASADVLSISGRYSLRNRTGSPLRFESLSAKSFDSWSGCRAGVRG